MLADRHSGDVLLFHVAAPCPLLGGGQCEAGATAKNLSDGAFTTQIVAELAEKQRAIVNGCLENASPSAWALDLYFATICSGDGLFSQMNSRRSVSGSSV